MFKFFKEMLDTVKEGMAEGRAELAQETAEREAKAQQDGAALEARLAASSRYENMAVALAAIYRETFAPELKAAREANRGAVHLLCVPIPDEEVGPWKKLLARDFDADGEAQAREAIADTHDAAEAMARSTDGELAVWIARFAHLATGSAAVGYLQARGAGCARAGGGAGDRALRRLGGLRQKLPRRRTRRRGQQLHGPQGAGFGDRTAAGRRAQPVEDVGLAHARRAAGAAGFALTRRGVRLSRAESAYRPTHRARTAPAVRATARPRSPCAGRYGGRGSVRSSCCAPSPRARSR